MDEDVFGMNDKRNKSAAKGRRAKQQNEPEPPPPPPTSGPAFDGATEDILGDADTAKKVHVLENIRIIIQSFSKSAGPNRPSRRVGGWGADGAKKRNDDFEDARLRPSSPFKDDDNDSDNDIPVIPDLEDQPDEDFTAQIAVAPTVVVNRVATYRELDNDLLRHAAFLTLDNEIDLKLLSRCLSAESEVTEEDKHWDWDRIFTEVTSEILTERELEEDATEEAIVTS